jgi:hypothetical protein
MSESYNLGYFLKKEYVQKGFDLLEKQINEQSHTFKTIELEIYRREEYLKTFDINNYYDRLIKADTFYNYPKLFYNNNYNIPKSNLGVRKFNFTSFNLLLLYYSIGFYIKDIINLSNHEIESHKKHKNKVFTYYGGLIDLENSKSSNIYYHSDYKAFLKGINKTANKYFSDGNKVVVIKLDIQDFFHNVDHKILIDVIEKYSLPSSRESKSFNSESQESILQLLNFMVNDNKGLPLSANNIISNFISHLYLYNLDNYIIEKIINRENYSYFRYVDDFYIICYQDKKVSNTDIGELIFRICISISDYLLSNLDLKINNLKSKRFIIESEDDLDEFISNGRYFSFLDCELEYENEKLEDNLNKILAIIESIKYEFQEKGETSLENEESNILKEIFLTSVKNNSMNNYLESKDSQDKLEEAFKNWNFLLTYKNIKSFMYFIGKSRSTFKQLEDFLCDNFETVVNKTQLLNLLEKVILHENYNNSLDDKIKSISDSNLVYYYIIRRLILPKKDLMSPDLPIDADFLVHNSSLMQQIKMMTLAERNKNYNLAFNHLLNCFHFYCFCKFTPSGELKKFDRNEVVKCLQNIISLSDLSFIISFFDRRNKNSISHPGEGVLINWVVDDNEYYRYKDKTKELIENIKKRSS